MLIAGGGVAALEALLALRAAAGELPHVRVLAPDADFVLRASAVLEPFARGHTRRIPLRAIVESQSAELVPDLLAEVDPARRVVTTAGGEELAYDELLIALGARGEDAFPGAVTFGGPQDRDAVVAVLAEAERGDDRGASPSSSRPARRGRCRRTSSRCSRARTCATRRRPGPW